MMTRVANYCQWSANWIRLATSLPLVVGAITISMPVFSAPCRTHVTQAGQSLGKIAKYHNVTVDAIVRLNDLNKNAVLPIGRVLYIPSPEGASECQIPRNRRVAAQKSPSALSAERARNDAKNKTKDDNSARKSQVNAKDKEKRRDTTSATTSKGLPASWTQTQKSAAERGVNPCNTPDVGNGIYRSWDRSVLMGQMLTAQRGGISKSGKFDVMFHFHGHDPVRKEWVRVMDGTVLVAVTLGIGSGPYESTFRDSGVFERYVKSVEKRMAEISGNPRARARKIGLSAWSAGYGAVGEILRTSYGKRVVDSVVLLDGLHCGYQGQEINELQVEPFVDFARQAVRGRKFMFVSHSSIIPPGYASTTETANYLISKLGGRSRRARSRGTDPMGLDLITRYDRGGFHVRGYQGNDKMDHCAHIGLLRDVLKVHIRPRWNSPKGYRRR